MIYYFAITQKFSQIVFEYESLANFAGNTKNTHAPPPYIKQYTIMLSVP